MNWKKVVITGMGVALLVGCGGKKETSHQQMMKQHDEGSAAVSQQTASANIDEILKKGLCLTCHSTDGSQKVGPTWKGLYGKKITVIRDGKEVEVTVDEEYLRRSIKEPNAEIVKGFAPMMPPANLTDEEIDRVVEYIKGLK